MRIVILYVWLAVTSAAILRNNTNSSNRTFPPSFFFGAATSAYQIEGAWNVDGKSWSIWDHLVRTEPDKVADCSNGDIAANSYYGYKRDIEMLKAIGATRYRFSISWPRILPDGYVTNVNQLGIDHYNAVIDALIANDITPMVTIYHWDLPQVLQEEGGWLNEDIVDWFGNYSRVLYENFGDRVKHWMTINEPYIHCHFGYGYGAHAPLISSPGIGFYECGRQILLAHARAYHIYNDEFRDDQGGVVGIVLASDYVFPASDSDDDIQGTSDYLDFQLGQYMHPIWVGNYPQVMISRIKAKSVEQGYNSSRLRGFSEDEIEYIKGTSDFLGLNHYLTNIVYRNESVLGMYEIPSYEDDMYAASFLNMSWPASQAPWIREYGPGLHHLLMYIKDNYNNPLVYITENGVSTTAGLVDDVRVSYYRSYLNAVLDALDEGCDVQGYITWSLLDNFEWQYGYTQRFGLYEVDWEDDNRTRTARKSAYVFAEIVRSRVIDYDYNPDPYENVATF